MTNSSPNPVAAGFSTTATDYDRAVRHNIEGARRLIGSLPGPAYDRVLDVGCGTGFASLAMLQRFSPRRITGVDAAAGMLEEFRAKLGDSPGVHIEIHEADVLEMPVESDSFDAVICSMAFHWFPDKPRAAIALAGPLRAGVDLAILCPGRGGDEEFRQILSTLNPPVPLWLATFDAVRCDIPELERYLEDAGLDVLDVWIERRIRRTSAEEYLERRRVVASHLNVGLPPDELADLHAQVAEAMRKAAGPRGFEYSFMKLFAIARKPR